MENWFPLLETAAPLSSSLAIASILSEESFFNERGKVLSQKSLWVTDNSTVLLQLRATKENSQLMELNSIAF